jgi:hypothetical protein
MQAASYSFYRAAVNIGVHPFIEFTGLMNEYVKVCKKAHEQGIDFSECNTHSGISLPMRPYEVSYVNEKLECIFTGRSVMQESVMQQRAQGKSWKDIAIARGDR